MHTASLGHAEGAFHGAVTIEAPAAKVCGFLMRGNRRFSNYPRQKSQTAAAMQSACVVVRQETQRLGQFNAQVVQGVESQLDLGAFAARMQQEQFFGLLMHPFVPRHDAPQARIGGVPGEALVPEPGTETARLTIKQRRLAAFTAEKTLQRGQPVAMFDDGEQQRNRARPGRTRPPLTVSRPGPVARSAPTQ